MKKPLLAVLALAAVALVAVAIFENMPERRMDRRYDKLLRTYGDPKQLYQRVFDDRDLVGFVLVTEFLAYSGLERCDCDARTLSGSPDVNAHKGSCGYTHYVEQHDELVNDFSTQFKAALCDCGGDPKWDFSHSEDCNLERASGDMQKTWGPYILRKKKEFHAAWLNR